MEVCFAGEAGKGERMLIFVSMKGLCVVLAVTLAVSAGLNVWQCRGRRDATVADTVRVVRVDTVRRLEPVARESVAVRYVTAVLPRGEDSVGRIGRISRISPISPIGRISRISSDSVVVRVPIEQRRYSDDSTYTAWVSGYEARLDSVEVYHRREVVTVTRERGGSKRWGLGVQAGVGYAGGEVRPYLGVGVSYRLLEW